MRITKLSLLAGAVLAVVATALATAGAKANPGASVQVAQMTDTNEPRMRGTVRSVVGTRVLVELDRAEEPFQWLGMSRSELGAYNIMGGTPVYVQGNRIVGLAHQGPVTPRTSDFTSRTQALWADYERSLNDPNTPVVPAQPSFAEPPPVPPEAIPAPAPIPGLW